MKLIFKKSIIKSNIPVIHRVDLSKSQLAVVRAGSLTRNYQQSNRSPPILWKNLYLHIYLNFSIIDNSILRSFFMYIYVLFTFSMYIFYVWLI